MEKLPIEEFLKVSAALPLLDVRSPGEYEAGHIPKAQSFPLFTNEERAIVGTLYKQQGRQPAIKKGLEIIGPKMVRFIEEAEKLQSDTIALHCWRGGMRSESMAWLLEQYGIQTIVMEGGYKAYRNHLMDFFEKPLPLQVLTGFTGSKKTELLHLMKAEGAQVIDLEGLANHQGSRFGNEKSSGQPTTEQFQNLVFDAFHQMDLNHAVWVEDESMRIGRVTLVESFYRQKNNSPHVFLEIDKAERAAFLVEDYGMLDKSQLKAATEAIRKKLGYDNAKQAQELIDAGNLKAAAEIILTYYDKRYQQSIDRKKELIAMHHKITMTDLPALAKKLAHENLKVAMP